MSNHLNRRAAFQRLSTMAVALGAARVLPARAQAYPSRAITLVVPYTPGGTTDNIVRAIQLVSTERGRDPRDYALVPFGGAGPLHAARIAEELGMDPLAALLAVAVDG